MNYDVQFPYLYPHQQDVFNDIKESEGTGRSFVLKSKRQVGKSVLCLVVLLYFAFKNAGSIGVLVEPTLSQSRRVFKQLIKAIGGDGSEVIKSSNATLLEVEFTNGSQIVMKSAEQGKEGSNLRGLTVKNSVLILDEGAYLSDSVFFTLDPTVDATRSSTLIVSTPLFKNGEFYERYRRGLDPKNHNLIKSYDWAAYDLSAFLPADKLKWYEETMSPLKFRTEILGEFIDDSALVFAGFRSCVKKPAPSLKPVYAGIDWSAGDDGDYTVLTLITEDRKVTECIEFKNFDSVDLVNELAKVIKEKGLKRVQVEKNSIGKVYYDMLKRQVDGGILKLFTTTNESKREIVEEVIKAFQSGTIEIPEDPELIKELQHYAVEKTPSGKITYNGIGANDDYVISLCLAYDLCPKVDRPRGKFSISFA